MNRSQKITAGAATLVVVGMIALAAPPLLNAASWSAQGFEWAAERFAPAVESTAVPEEPRPAAIQAPVSGPGKCTTSSRISLGAEDGEPFYPTLFGEPVEMGASIGAAGEALLDAEGQVIGYEVEPNDNLIAIGERFCIDFVTVGMYNHRFGPTAIQPGDILVLRPDPAVPWFDYNSPLGVEGPFVTAPYREAIGEIRSAARAGDLAAARAVWDGYLADVMGPRAAVVGEAIDDGDVALLRGMFP